MNVHPRLSFGLLLLASIASFPSALRGADPAPALAASSAPDPNLPADYLDRILTLVRQEHPQQVVSNFIYSDPQKVRFIVGPGVQKKPMTAVSAYFTPQVKSGPPSFKVITRVVLFDKGLLFTDVGPGDPNLDLSTEDPPPPTDPNLPADFRERLLTLERQRNPKWSISGMGFSDPVHALVRDPAQPGPPVEMSAVVYGYGPMEKATGSPYLMIVDGAALFNKGAFVRTIGSDDKTVEWTNGKPATRPDSQAQRAKDGARPLTYAEKLFDPVTGPAERRTVRRQIWNEYGHAFDAMKLPSETVAKLVNRLEAVDEAQRKALYTESKKGVDPFSAEMNKAIEDEKESAARDLETVLGPEQTDRLKYIAEAPGYYRRVMANGFDAQMDLQDAGIPMMDDQIVAVGMICEDVLDPKRNPDVTAMYKQPPNPVSHISATWQEVLNRLSKLLTPEQVTVIALNLSDRSSFTVRDQAEEQRMDRRRMMAQYGAALTEMNLSAEMSAKAKDLLIKRADAPQALGMEARQRGEDPRSDKVKAAQKVATDAVNDELKTLLGDAGYQRLEHLHEILPIERGVVLSEACDCKAAGCALTPEQIRSLSDAKWQVNQLKLHDPRNLHEDVDPATGLTTRSTATLAHSAAFLSPAQQQVVKTTYRDLAAAMNAIAAEQPPPPKHYPPPANAAGGT